MKRKIVFGFLAGLILCAIFALTFQGAEGSLRLSEGVRKGLAQIGLKVSGESLRSNVHIVMYLILGTALALFGRSMGWKPWTTILIGCGIGLLDETVKVFLPTREFDLVDLLKDFLGVGIANLIWLRYWGSGASNE